MPAPRCAACTREKDMITLKTITLGVARDLTRDGQGGLYTEIHAFDSRKPVG